MIDENIQNFAIFKALYRLGSRDGKSEVAVDTEMGFPIKSKESKAKNDLLKSKLSKRIITIICISIFSDVLGVGSYVMFQIISTDPTMQGMALMCLMFTINVTGSHMIFEILLLESTKDLFMSTR